MCCMSFCCSPFDINLSPSLFPFHSSFSSPLPPHLTENSHIFFTFTSFHLTLRAYPFLSTSFVWIAGSLSLFVPIYSAAKAVQFGHYVVVDPRRIELYSFGGSCHLLSDNRATLQGVQWEESEASGTLGDRQQTERRQAEERWERTDTTLVTDPVCLRFIILQTVTNQCVSTIC